MRSLNAATETQLGWVLDTCPTLAAKLVLNCCSQCQATKYQERNQNRDGVGVGVRARDVCHINSIAMAISALAAYFTDWQTRRFTGYVFWPNQTVPKDRLASQRDSQREERAEETDGQTDTPWTKSKPQIAWDHKYFKHKVQNMQKFSIFFCSLALFAFPVAICHLPLLLQLQLPLLPLLLFQIETERLQNEIRTGRYIVYFAMLAIWYAYGIIL